MQQEPKQNLREERPHGTSIFPCAYYLMKGISARLRVKHHWHEEIEILYLKKGKYKIDINMETHECPQECFFFINPGELHDIRSLSSNYEEQAIVFDPQMLRFQSYDSIDEYILQPIANKELTFPRILDASNPVYTTFKAEYERISAAFCRNQQVTFAGEEIYPNDMVAQMQIKASLLQMLALLMDQELMCHTVHLENQRIESIKTVLAYITRHYPEKLYIQDLSSLVNMNEQYFCRFFKKAIGKPPIDYINDYRLTKAMHFLENTELPVTEVSLECGFNNMGNFQRLFKRKTGTTPLQYRKKSMTQKSK
ncbi:MAG: AraC family transcriptional regulator [Clostridia bacterium]|nr:AraC family transcriptional regulator [Clostridia bacterium]NCC43601.1 AraC family transcriptional regulator [Clostridia bacterium]